MGGIAGVAGPPKIGVPGLVDILISVCYAIVSLSAIFLITRFGLSRIFCVMVPAVMNGPRSWGSLKVLFNVAV